MSKIILDGKVVQNDWIRVENPEMQVEDIPAAKVLLPLHLWNQHSSDLLGQGRELGLWLRSDQLPEDIDGDIDTIAVIAVEFPVFTDGRGFSIGRLLRERYGFRNQLRAFGAPIRDQLTYLRRCGFNAFQLAEHYDPQQALDSLSDFTEFYQTAVDHPQPLFRRQVRS